MDSYGSLCTEFYDLDKPQAPPLALTFYMDEAARAQGRVLEPMCGSGRFLLPMLRAGLPVDGTDSSPQMIAACRRRAELERLAANLFEQPLGQLSLPHRYSMAFISAGSIGLLVADSDLRAGLLRLREHLVPGGTLLLELADVDANEDDCTEAELEPRVVHCADGATITYTCRAIRLRDPEATMFAGTYVKSLDDRIVCTEQEELLLRHHKPDALGAVLLDCGFKQSRCHQSSDLPFLAESGCLLIEARTDA